MFLMGRLVARSARSLAVMIGAAQAAEGRGRNQRRDRPAAGLFFLQAFPQFPSAGFPRFTSQE
jgi:hypothetical protein